MNPSFKKAIFLVTILIGPALATDAFARSLSSTISMSEFKRRCNAAGGQVVDYSAGGVMCRLAGGGSVVCYSTDGGGINCDVLVEPPSRSAPKRFLDQLQGTKMSQ
jgi:hypothetical protein